MPDYKVPENKRALFIISNQASIVHIVRTNLLEFVKEFCIPVVALLWNQPELIAELKNKGYEVEIIPDYGVTDEYLKIKDKIDYWYFEKILKSPSTHIERKYRSHHFSKWKNIRRANKRRIEILKARFFPGYVKKNFAKEKILVTKILSYETYKEWIKKANVSFIYTITPFLPEIDLIARIAAEKNIKLITAIHSFDNITKRGWASAFYDIYIVWNRYNKNELIRINSALQNKVFIAGALQFDFHYNDRFIWSRDKWLHDLEIARGKKIILYGAGIWWLFPYEQQYIKDIDDAIECNHLPADTIILLRCHPLDKSERWDECLKSTKHVVIDKFHKSMIKVDRSNYTLSDIERLSSTLYHTDVHVNLCSTMAIDGCVFNKPQIGPAYDEVQNKNERNLRQMYWQEHYLPIIHSGAVALGKSKTEFITLISDALNKPHLFNQHCRQCLEEVITYTDGKTINRILSILKEHVK